MRHADCDLRSPRLHSLLGVQCCGEAEALAGARMRQNPGQAVCRAAARGEWHTLELLLVDAQQGNLNIRNIKAAAGAVQIGDLCTSRQQRPLLLVP